MKKLFPIMLLCILIVILVWCFKEIELKPDSSPSPSVTKEIISDDLKFTFMSAHSEYERSEMLDKEHPFYFSLEIEYIGDDDSTTVRGGMSLATINLYDSNGSLVGIENAIPMISMNHVIEKDKNILYMASCPITDDGKKFELPQTGEYTAEAWINYGTKENDNIKYTMEIPIKVIE